MPMRIEAATAAGKLTHFELIGPWTRPARQAAVVVKTGLAIANPLLLGSIFVATLAACLLARRNLRAGRGDRRGARLVAVVLVALGLIGWLMKEHHVTTGGELTLFFRALSILLLSAGSLWVLYIAAEPFARRRWPGILVAWTRLLAGDWRDTVVGREVLIGCAVGAVIGFLAQVAVVLPSWFGRPEELPLERSIGYAFAEGASASRMLDPVGWAIGDVFLILALYLILTTVLRKGWLAAIVCALLMASGAAASESPWIALVPALAAAALTLIVLLRSGLVAVMVAYIISGLLMMYPLTFRFSTWYSGIGFLSLFFMAAFAAFGFVASIQGQKLLDIDGET
jgi:serine/threonine-protein kinase